MWNLINLACHQTYACVAKSNCANVKFALECLIMQSTYSLVLYRDENENEKILKGAIHTLVRSSDTISVS